MMTSDWIIIGRSILSKYFELTRQLSSAAAEARSSVRGYREAEVIFRACSR